MYRLHYYDDTLATNDKSNRLAHLSARSLDCMPGIHNELEPEVKISLTESWIVASQRPAEHTRVSNEHKLSRHLRVESVEPHKAGITLLAADCWSTAAHHCFQRLVAAAFAASSSSNSFAFAAAFGAAAAAARPPFSCQ